MRVELRQRSAGSLRQQAFDGILLPGSGADVDPALYGHPRPDRSLHRPTLCPTRPSTRILLGTGECKAYPLLAICFGLQSLNVYRGGTLIQHVPPCPVNHRAGRAVLDAHGQSFLRRDEAALPWLLSMEPSARW